MAKRTTFRNRSINADLRTSQNPPSDTPMRNFYRDKTIFLTGGTGFLGHIWIEKLLRCDVKAIYLLSRDKKGKSADQRLHEMLNGPVFDGLRQQNPKFVDRIRVVNGSTRELGVGLSADAKKELVENVEIVLHAAADVRFDNPLKELSLVNLRGTRELLRLAEEMRKLQMFAYISTAYAHCVRTVIEERFYDSPMQPEALIRLAEGVDGDEQKEEILEILQEILIAPWPNTYTYTKAVSEELVRSYGHKMPIVIVRPSIVISTHEDPIPGWGNNIYGLNGMLVAAGYGFLRIMFYDPDLRAEVVCADMVTNSTLAAIWDRATNKSTEAAHEPLCDGDNDPGIYMVVSDDYELTWGRVSADMTEQFMQYPSMQSLWIPTPSTTKCHFLAFIYVLLYHALPGLLFDIVLTLKHDKKRLLPAYRKCHLFMVKLRFFMAQQWQMDKTRMCAVYDRMDEEDQKFFPCDVRKFNWSEFRWNYHLGLMRYVGNEKPDCFDAARKKLRWLKLGHFCVLSIFYISLAGLIYYFGRFCGLNTYLQRCFERVATNRLQN